MNNNIGIFALWKWIEFIIEKICGFHSIFIQFKHSISFYQPHSASVIILEHIQPHHIPFSSQSQLHFRVLHIALWPSSPLAQYFNYRPQLSTTREYTSHIITQHTELLGPTLCAKHTKPDNRRNSSTTAAKTSPTSAIVSIALIK